MASQLWRQGLYSQLKNINESRFPPDSVQSSWELSCQCLCLLWQRKSLSKHQLVKSSHTATGLHHNSSGDKLLAQLLLPISHEWQAFFENYVHPMAVNLYVPYISAQYWIERQRSWCATAKLHLAKHKSQKVARVQPFRWSKGHWWAQFRR